MDSPFDRETAVEPLGDGRYRASLSRAWWVLHGPNGGYLAAILLRALEATVGDPARSPRSLTVHYLSPAREGDVEVTARAERSGRSLTSCSARMEQDGRVVALALAAFSAPRPGPELQDVRMPEVAPPESVPPRDELPDGVPPIAARWDQRWVIGTPPWEGGAPSEEARAGGWIRLPEHRAVDAAVAAAITDAWAPPLFTRVREPFTTPTVDLTIHFRAALPVPGLAPDAFVLADFRTGAVADGFLEADGAVWAPDGTLIAISRQLGVCVPMPAFPGS